MKNFYKNVKVKIYYLEMKSGGVILLVLVYKYYSFMLIELLMEKLK